MERTQENIDFSKAAVEAMANPIPGFHPLDLMMASLKRFNDKMVALALYSYFIEEKLTENGDGGVKYDFTEKEYSDRACLFSDLFSTIDLFDPEKCREVRKVVELRFNYGQWVVQEMKERAEIAMSKQRDFAIPVRSK